MNSQQYIYFISPVVSSFPSFTEYQALSPYSFSQSPQPFSSTSNQFFFNASFQVPNYPVNYNFTSLPCNYNRPEQQVEVQHQYHQFKIEAPPSPQQEGSNIASSSIYNSEKSQSSIKVQELQHLEILKSSYKNPFPHKSIYSYEYDRDYIPNKAERKVPRKRTPDNQNRNVIPNEINQMISFIQKKSKSGHLVAKLFQKFPPQKQSYTITRFYLYEGLLKDKINHYSTDKSLRLMNQFYEPQGRVWEIQQQRYYNKLCRVLVRHFLQQDSIFIILTSKRMKKHKKIDHLKATRTIKEKVFQILRNG